MSRETALWLNTNTLIGYTDKRGTAWHYRQELQGKRSNHYPGPIPVGDVQKRLFNFTVAGEPIHRPNGDEIPGMVAQVRQDTGQVFKVFTDGYQGHDYNEWLIGVMSNILGDTLQIGSAGLLRGGAQAWVQVEVPENIVTPEGVEFRPNLAACTSFDGSLATTFKRMITNIVCDNTMRAGFSESGQGFKARHSKHSGLKIADAREALAIVETMADDFATEVQTLAQMTVSDKAWSKFLDLHIGTPSVENKRAVTTAEKHRDALSLLWNKDERVSPWKGTGWGVLQAVNTHAQHLTRVNKSKNGEGNRFERNMFAALTGKVDTLDADTRATLALALA